MFAAQRKKIIKDILIKNKSVDINTLTEVLKVSDVTVRKDLDILEQEGFLIKNHGGAVLVESYQVEEKNDLIIENTLEKKQIVDLAYTLIEDGDTIFLGSGSTCYEFSKKINQKKNITVVTTNINALSELLPNVSNVILVGGEVRYRDGFMYSAGERTVESLKGIYVNKSFVSADAVDLMAGFTVNDASSLSIWKQIPNFSKQVVVLVDYSKFDKVGIYQIAPIDFPTCIVSNDKLDDKYKQFFYEKNIKVLAAYNL